jgi:PAS domain S-box-containing protein/putative nucleotidyltransferase with HDIG domain
MLNEEVCRLIVENAADGIAILQDDQFRYVNFRLQEIVGYSIEELSRLPSDSLIEARDLAGFFELSKARTRGKNIPAAVEATLKHKDGRDVFVELNAAQISHNGRPAMLILIRDITSRKQADEELKNTLEKLRKAIGATIQAITLTVEMRDPYTAGHQRRVSDLARSIAGQLGFSTEKIDAIRMAAAIHDLGKISVPAEILSKPGRLTETEHTLLRTHSQVGYVILKQIEFPWPIAQIVLQHHERINGSGYPQKLRGDEILIEAKILGVADVVEAMVSHRPYRKAFCQDRALEEIRRNRGVLYDPSVVDACLSLFNVKEYSFQ